MCTTDAAGGGVVVAMGAVCGTTVTGPDTGGNTVVCAMRTDETEVKIRAKTGCTQRFIDKSPYCRPV
jgi:hypothetical protein